MKRLRIWLKELSLSQQLLTLIFLVVTVFTVFFFVYLSESVNEFVEKQMYSMLHRAQNNIAFNYSMDMDIEEIAENTDPSIIHLFYDKETRQFSKIGTTTLDPQLTSHLLEEADGLAQEVADRAYVQDRKTYFYSLARLDSHTILISLMSDSYRSDFKNMLLNSVINLNVLVVSLLFVCLMLWISSLIHPLNQIRNYIEKVSRGEEAELHIERRDEIGQVAQALVAMKEELDKQEKIKEEMIQNISHDLKTPIATIKSYGESIKDGIYPYETLEKSVDVIIEHADRLEKKVYSLIMLNKLGYLTDDGMAGDTLDMSAVINKAILSLKVIRPELEISTQLEKIYFHGEEDPWRVVVENLLDNSIRYATHEIVITLNEKELTVANDGPLMSEERLNKLFKPYEKGTDGKFGLGLSIVYRVCTTYGYRAEAENLNNGVIFRISRPGGLKREKPRKLDGKLKGKKEKIREDKNENSNS
ncbi:HAMP domain-containing sensor histidine kinase [Holdemania filiformis]|uniref:HAMP domain-containing sensor histidine kinase n=1 Tax=Holdemania filiformis TaxID=61171 RepID=UPI0026743DF2|nr:HAMP domain-containing sensor histidine kinase [Holdemania filiformis]